MMTYYGWHMVRPHFGWGFGWVFGIIFWVFAILLIVAIIRSVSERKSDQDIDEEEPNKALNILKERYAKGEINSREFEKMKKEIA